MERILRENDDKGGWGNASWRFLLGRLDEEVSELKAAFERCDRNLRELIHEAVDVANFAMMIADNANKEIEERATKDANP